MIVFNPTNERVSFRILPAAPPDGVPNWRRKKLVRAGIINVLVEPKANYNLGQHGVTSAVGHPELQALLRRNRLDEIKKPLSPEVAAAVKEGADEILRALDAPSRVRERFAVTKVANDDPTSPLASTVPPSPGMDDDDEPAAEETEPDEQALANAQVGLCGAMQQGEDGSMGPCDLEPLHVPPHSHGAVGACDHETWFDEENVGLIDAGLQLEADTTHPQPPFNEEKAYQEAQAIRSEIAAFEDARGLNPSDEIEETREGLEEDSDEREGVDLSGGGDEGQEEAPVAPVEPSPVSAEEAPEEVSDTVCSACKFEAANPRGLKRHQASCKPFQAQQGLAMDRGRVRVGDLDLIVEIARMPSDKQRGLQGHAPLSDQEGMLFVFPSPAWAEFHMGKVEFPIDVIFVQKGAVIAIEHGTPGRDDFWGHNNVSYVLEVRGGLCKDRGVDEGTQVHVEGGQRSANNQSKDLLRTLTEADLEKDLAAHIEAADIQDAGNQLQDQKKFACAVIVAQLMDPGMQLGVPGEGPNGGIRWLVPGPELERARWKLAKRAGTRGFLRLLGMLQEGAEDSALERTWRHVSGTLDFWERDAVVHGLVQAGFGQAVGFLRQAQTDSQLDIGWQHVPGAVSQTSPEDRYQGNQIPADTPGVGIDGPGPDQTMGYDPTHGDDLLGGDVGPMRPAASLDVSMKLALRLVAQNAACPKCHGTKHRKPENCPFYGQQAKQPGAPEPVAVPEPAAPVPPPVPQQQAAPAPMPAYTGALANIEADIDDMLEEHGDSIKQISKSMYAMVPGYTASIKDPAWKARFEAMDPKQQALHVGGHLIGQYYEANACINPELHNEVMGEWRVSSGNGTSTMMHGIMQAAGVKGFPSPKEAASQNNAAGRKMGANDPEMTAYARNAYAFSQAALRRLGIKELSVFRGVKGQGLDSEPPMEGEEVQSNTRELSSFSTDADVADAFGRSMEYKVPAHAVFASSLTRPAIGSETCPTSKGEAEIVVMGSSDLRGKIINGHRVRE